MTIKKFETNLVFINVNKLKHYKYMESKIQKKEKMSIYWEHNVGGIHEANFDTEKDNEGCEIKKPQMKNVEDKNTNQRSSCEHNFYFQ